MKRMLVVFLLLTMILVGCSPRDLTMEEKSQLYTAAANTVSVKLTSDFEKIPTSTETPVPPTLEPTATETMTAMPTASPTPSWDKIGPGEVDTLILLYNSIASSADEDPFYQWEADTFISVDNFRYQMQMLSDNGYTTIPISLLVDAILYGAEMPPKPIVITFGTYHKNLYEIVFPIMQEFGFTGTVFLVQDYEDAKYMTTSTQMKEMVAAGWEIGSKGKSSVNLTTPGLSLGEEISGSRLFLEEKYGVPVTVFSYPGGAINDNVSSRVAEWGYKAAVGLFKSSKQSSATLYYMPRYEVLNTWTDNDFVNILPWKPANVPIRSTEAVPTAQ